MGLWLLGGRIRILICLVSDYMGLDVWLCVRNGVLVLFICLLFLYLGVGELFVVVRVVVFVEVCERVSCEYECGFGVFVFCVNWVFD